MQTAVLDHGAHEAADVQLGSPAPMREVENLLHAGAGLGHVRAGGLLGEAHHDEARERGGQRLQALDRDARSTPQLGIDEAVEHLGLLAQQLAVRSTFSCAAGCTVAQRRHQTVAHARAAYRSLSLLASSRQARPRARQ